MNELIIRYEPIACQSFIQRLIFVPLNFRDNSLHKKGYVFMTKKQLAEQFLQAVFFGYNNLSFHTVNSVIAIFTPAALPYWKCVRPREIWCLACCFIDSLLLHGTVILIDFLCNLLRSCIQCLLRCSLSIQHGFNSTFDNLSCFWKNTHNGPGCCCRIS